MLHKIINEVTFETKCWENDWEFIVKTDRLKKVIENNKYNFKERILYINNVNDLNEVKLYADKLIAEGVLTSYVVVEDYAAEALNYFGIDKESFKGGYYYSIQELVSIYLCKTDYLLHFSGDSAPEKPIEWIDKAIEKLNSDDRFKVANLTWNNRYDEAKQESLFEDDGFYIGSGFSDQNYLIKTKDFKEKIYNEKNPVSERYPAYGGELFEKRVDAWMKNHQLLRLTYKHGNYIHQNIEPKKSENLQKNKKQMIYDCFMFFNELDLLELRLNELNDTVDKFVLVEATRTFTNKPKELFFEQNKQRFSKFLHKIIHIVVDDFPQSDNPWIIEYHQKDAMKRGLTGCNPEDIILVSDADEIPSPAAIEACKQIGGIKSLQQYMFNYYLNNLNLSESPWGPPKALFFKDFTMTASELRWNIKDGPKIFPGGWHFTYLGGAEVIKQKIESFSHQEFNNSNFNEVDKIEKAIEQGTDVLNRKFQYCVVKVDKNFPQYLLDNPQKFAKYIKEDTNPANIETILKNQILASAQNKKQITSAATVQIHPKIENLINAFNNLGNAYNSLDRYDLALEYYEKAFQYNQNNAETHYNLGLAYKNLNNTSKAIEHFEKSISLNNNEYRAYDSLGRIFHLSNEIQKAYDYYQKAFSLNPEYVGTLINLGNIYAQTGNENLAYEHYKKALLNSNNDVDGLIKLDINVLLPQIRYKMWQENQRNKRAFQIKNYTDTKIAVIYFFEQFEEAEFKKIEEIFDKQEYKNYKIFKVNNNFRSAFQEIKNNNYSHVCFIEQGDIIPQYAILSLVSTIHKSNPDLIYTDEDVINIDNTRKTPYFKTEFAPFMLLSNNYLNALLCIKLSETAKNELNTHENITQNSLYKLVLSLTNKDISTFRIPDILYYRSIKNHNKLEQVSTKDIIEEEIQKRKYSAKILESNNNSFNTIKFYNNDTPKVSIIIPFKDKIELLKNCINSIESKSTYKNYEIIMVNNRSSEQESLDYYQNSPHRKLDADFEFNYSRINNIAVDIAEGEYILMLNNDTEIITPDWIESMLGLAQLEKVALVGAKLLYSNGNIQHSGMINLGNKRIRHSNRYMPSDNGGYQNYNNIIREYSFVTGACVMISKEKFLKIGGFDEKLNVEYNDVDFCLKSINAGYLNVYNPHGILYHHESISRMGKFTDQVATNANYFQNKWNDVLQKTDPYYNPNLSSNRLDFSIKAI